MKPYKSRASALPVLVAALSVSAPALAETLPAGAGTGVKAATTGTTDVTGADKFEAPVAKPAEKDAKDAKDATEAQILGGGLLATGNSRSMALTGSAQFRMRREANQLSAAGAANYAQSAAPRQPTDTQEPEVKPTVENFQGKVRYDRFVAKELALFLALTGRRDRFQQLDFRLNVDPGVAYYFVDEASQQLWGELGYDFQFDVRRQEGLDAALAACTAAGATTCDDAKTKARHSARLFTGYQNALNEAVSFTTGIEYLQGISETAAWRLNWDMGLTSKIGGNFSLATTFGLKYDHKPVNDTVKNTDTMTAVSLVYQLL